MKLPAPTARRWILGLAGAGGLLSLALELVHYRAYTAPSSSSLCELSERLDCTAVALSKVSVLLGVPLPVWGFAGFVAIGIAAALRSRWVLPLSALAAFASAVLLALSVLSIGALCFLCEGVHLVSFALLALAIHNRKAEQLSLRERDSTALALGPPLGLLLAAALFLPRYWGAFGWEGELPFDHGMTPDGLHWIGAATPELTIEEFVDYSCPHCRAATVLSLRRLARHPSELRLIRRYYPRVSCTSNPSEGRCLSFRIAHCAGEQGKLWQVDRWLFEHFELRREYDLNEVAREVGLDGMRLESCVEARDTYEWAANVWRSARKLRVPGTPYYRVENELLGPAEITARIETL